MTTLPASFPVLGPDIISDQYKKLDLSCTNKELRSSGLAVYLQQSLSSFPFLAIGYGGYLEERSFYRDSMLFSGDARTIHLGIDLWAPAGTPVFAPYEGIIHSFANNAGHLDYGPTIILYHPKQRLHTLYGHLNLNSLDGLSEGMALKSGQLFAHIGDSEVNGSWPPHLHLQCIREMAENKGDFPGVIHKTQLKDYTSNCPDPIELIGL